MFLTDAETGRRYLLQFSKFRESGLFSYRWNQHAKPMNAKVSLEDLKLLKAELDDTIQAIEDYRLRRAAEKEQEPNED
jgi:hypothetical protein